MNTAQDFLVQALADPRLKDKLEAIRKKYLGREQEQKDTIIGEVIALAKEAGVNLAASDFEVQKGEVNDEDLASVAGGVSLDMQILGGFFSVFGMQGLPNQPGSFNLPGMPRRF
jgi:hypothetical protein